jgi:hypothetical protein
MDDLASLGVGRPQFGDPRGAPRDRLTPVAERRFRRAGWLQLDAETLEEGQKTLSSTAWLSPLFSVIRGVCSPLRFGTAACSQMWRLSVPTESAARVV